MFHEQHKGKIIIEIEDIQGKVNSSMGRRGIAKRSDIAITTLLVNFASLSIENGKNPKQLIEKHIDGIIDMILQKNKALNTKKEVE